jgi:arylsulfatase A-like enzyme
MLLDELDETRFTAISNGMIKCIDDNVGRIIKKLKEEDLLDNTILVFTADHGDMRGEHRRQNKGLPLEASAKIPLVIRFPEQIKPGTQVDQVTNTVDCLPTFLSMMSVKTAGQEQGKDFSVLFQDQASDEWEDMTFMRSTGNPSGKTVGWVSATTQRYKLILSSEDEPWLLDLEKDPDELTNFIKAEDKQAVVKQLAQGLKQYGTQTKDPYLDHEIVKTSLAKLLA